MAVRVKDIMKFESLKNIQLVCGKKGISAYVSSVGVVDFEFDPAVDHTLKDAFQSESIALSSLYFAKDNPLLIMDAVQSLHAMGISALIYKSVYYDSLPEEVLLYADKVNFPIFKIGTDLYFDNITFEIMDAIRQEDHATLSHDIITSMITGNISKSQLQTCLQNISITFKEYAMAIFLKSRTSEFELRADKAVKNFYLNRNFNGKVFLSRYKEGLLILLTSKYSKEDAFQVIFNNILETYSIPKDTTCIGFSSIHNPREEMDVCVKEAYHAFLAAAAERKKSACYKAIGPYKFLIPSVQSECLKEFSDYYLTRLSGKKDILSTLFLLVEQHGDIYNTAASANCHHNTIRYRINKAKQLTGNLDISDQDFYADISLALRYYRLQEILEESEKLAY